jgi:hypothetical protein
MAARRGRKRAADTEFVVYNGVTYTRRPGKSYFKTNRWDKQRKRYYSESYHQAVWKHNFGPIPKGFVVHHKDENHDNNDPANLQLLRQGEHALLHNAFAEFNASERSKEHKKRVAKLCHQRAQPRDCVCQGCGAEFQSKRITRPKYCTIQCGERTRDRLRRAGL